MPSKKWTLKSKVKRGLSKVTLEEYLGEKKKAAPKKADPLHLTDGGKAKFIDECVKRGLPAPIPEYKPFVDIGRKHAIDFAFFFPDGRKLALEIEGMDHRKRARYESDLFKYNELSIRGWGLIRVVPKKAYHEDTYLLCLRFMAKK